MITFYAAVGCYRVKNENGKKSVYIQKLGKLHPISIPEFAIWSSLLWEVMTYDELKAAYQEIMGQQTGPVPDFDQLLLLLSKRKLILSGLGYTGVDALYRMLADAFVVPYRVSAPRKAWCLLRLLMSGKLQMSGVAAAARKRRLTDKEQRVLQLIEQTPLSTAELVRCFDCDIQDVSTPEKVIAGIFPIRARHKSALPTRRSIRPTRMLCWRPCRISILGDKSFLRFPVDTPSV